MLFNFNSTQLILFNQLSAQQQCELPFVSPCRTGCALSRCRSRRLCLALSVIYFYQKLSFSNTTPIQMFSLEELAWAPDAARKSLASAMVRPEEPLYQQLD